MNEWKISYHDWNPNEQPLRESLFALGNGYIVTRGAMEESQAGPLNYPGTYLACGYNRLMSEISGRKIENEDLVNWPNWLYLNFSFDKSKWFHLNDVEVLDFLHELNLQTGIVKRYVRFKDDEGRLTSITTRRFVHMGNKHFAALEWRIRPENWSGQVHVRTGLDGNIRNEGVARYQDLEGEHLQYIDSGAVGEDGIFLHVQTTQSKIRMSQAARIQVFHKDLLLNTRREMNRSERSVFQNLTFECREKEETRIEKIVSIYTSRDHAISDEVLQACKVIRRVKPFDILLKEHKKAWERLWHRCNIELSENNGKDSQAVLRLHIFHLLQTASFNSIDNDIGIPSRGWHGEAYRGHIFWDELFIFPFLNLRLPELTRELLLYRYRRLDEARFAAEDAGYEGAMYPWQSGSDGREESQVIHLNPKSGQWEPDNTHLQRHVNAAIAYNIYQYYAATLDIEFMSYYGVEMLLNISQFLSSLTIFNQERNRYEIHHVVGPDEFHTAYPDSEKSGLNNNAYTNVMTVWVLKKTLSMLNILAEERKSELLEKTGIEDETLKRWETICQKMFVPFHDQNIISQFEGYQDLKEFDWQRYRKKYGKIERLDRILHAEGDSPNQYKASKQADVLMLFYLFSADELKELFQGMEYPFDTQTAIPRNIQYYVHRTSFGSSLSRLVYSWVLARSDRESSWKYFQDALDVDFKDIQGGTTKEGIHLGAMAGTVDMVQRCYAGLEIRDDVLWINPALPDELVNIKMRIRYRGHWIRVQLNSRKVNLEFEQGGSPDVKIGVQNHVFNMRARDKKTIGF